MRARIPKLGLLWSLLCGVLFLLASNVRAGTLPSQANLAFQTSGASRPPTIGDWYTTATSASTDRRHRFLVEISQQLLTANGGSVNIVVNDAESNGAGGDEVTGTPDPTYFELRAPDGNTVLQSQTVPSGSLNGTTVTFTVTTPGSYQVAGVSGAALIPGDGRTIADLNDDDNSFTITIPSTSTLLGQVQSTFVHFAATPQSFTFYFLVGPDDPNLFLRNFDMDSSGTLVYTRPNLATVNGTVSGNGLWNGPAPTLNTGGDTVTVNTSTGTRPDVGVWQIAVNNITANNQWILEANAGAKRLTLLDQPPTTADAGNFTITPDDTLSTSIGTPVDHPFSVSNLFFTNDIFELSTANTAANYTVQLLDSGGTPLTDTDGDTKVDTGTLTPNQTKTFILRVTPLVGAGASDSTRINATSFMDAKVAPGSVTTQFITKTTTLSSTATISGNVYLDADHNGNLTNNETGTGVAGLFVKLVPQNSAVATQAVAVDPTTGAYSITGVAAGTFTLVLDNNNTLTDITPSIPNGYIGTEAGNGTRSVTVTASTTVSNQNFGLFNGSLLSGRVFNDNGTGGGTANNGVLDGGEVGISGVQVRLTTTGNTVLDTTSTDASGNYTLYVPAAQNGQQLRVVETNAANYLSTGGTVGNTGGTYSRVTDTTTFTNTAGTTYTGVNFGDVSVNVFTSDGTQNGVPGSTVIYPHVFTAGSGGSVTFSTSNVAAPANNLWQNVIYLDSNANGVLDAGEPIITAPIAVAANQQVAILVKEFVPANAPIGARDTITVTALFSYTNANPALTSTLTRTDTTTVAGEAGVVLTKSVNRATAKSGDLIIYTITYRNAGGTPVSSLVINDTTPAFTVFVSQSNGALPANLTSVTPTTPAVNSAGALKWTFAGNLAPNASGTVTFTVRLQ